MPKGRFLGTLERRGSSRRNTESINGCRSGLMNQGVARSQTGALTPMMESVGRRWQDRAGVGRGCPRHHDSPPGERCMLCFHVASPPFRSPGRPAGGRAGLDRFVRRPTPLASTGSSRRHATGGASGAAAVATPPPAPGSAVSPGSASSGEQHSERSGPRSRDAAGLLHGQERRLRIRCVPARSVLGE